MFYPPTNYFFNLFYIATIPRELASRYRFLNERPFAIGESRFVNILDSVFVALPYSPLKLDNTDQNQPLLAHAPSFVLGNSTIGNPEHRQPPVHGRDSIQRTEYTLEGIRPFGSGWICSDSPTTFHSVFLIDSRSAFADPKAVS